MQPLTKGEEDFRKRLKAWTDGKKAAEAAPGVMLRTTERERWDAWLAYFARHDCRRELARMQLCERDQPYSREPGTNIPWMQVPSNWPREFDASDSGEVGKRSSTSPSPIVAALEERERAVATWETGLRREIAPPHMQPKGEEDEAVRAKAIEHLDKLAVRKNEPMAKLSLEAVRALVRSGHGDFELSPEDEARLLAEAREEKSWRDLIR